LRSYKRRQSNLLEALEFDEFGKDQVLDYLNNLEHLRNQDETKLDQLFQFKANVSRVTNASVKLDKIYHNILENLDNCTNQDKKDAYTYLNLKVRATPEGADIKGYLDPGVIKSDSCLLTTEQTSASSSSHAYSYVIPFSFALKKEWSSELKKRISS